MSNGYLLSKIKTEFEMTKQYKVGDILKSEWNYYVLVCRDKEGYLYGSLLCGVDDSCRTIPYSLSGKHKKVFSIEK